MIATLLAQLPSLPLLIGSMAVALAAGFVRGFSGFGFSAVCVAGLSLFIAPSTVVPAVLALEIVASIDMLRPALRTADRSWVLWLLAGNAVFVPIGIALLAVLPPTELRLIVSASLLTAALALRAAIGHTFAPTPTLRIVAGAASGLLNGLAASGGVAAAMLLTAGGVPGAKLRGTMVVFLLFAGAWSLACAALLSVTASGATPLVGAQTLVWMAILAPGMLLGIRVGHGAFAGSDPAQFRKLVLNLLIVICLFGALRAGYDLRN
mgnify:CR=1 FL=1